MRLASVAVPVPFLDPLTYRVPDGLVTPLPGARVLVPLGTRTVTGCVVSGGATEERNLKDLIDVLDAEPFLPRDVLELALWVAEYYACGPGEAVAAAMPPYAWLESERRVQITDLGRAQIQDGRTNGMRGVVLRALGAGKSIRVETLVGASGRRPGSSRRRRPGQGGVQALVTTLAKEGLVTITQPLRGQAVAFKTVPVAALTVQGLDLAGFESRIPSPESRETQQSPGTSHAHHLGIRQREVIDLLRRLSERSGSDGARFAWDVRRDAGTPGPPWLGHASAKASRARPLFHPRRGHRQPARGPDTRRRRRGEPIWC